MNCGVGITAAIHLNVTISPTTITGILPGTIGSEHLFLLRTAFTTDITASVTLSGNGTTTPSLALEPPDNGGQCKELIVVATSAHLTCRLTPNPGPREESLARD